MDKINRTPKPNQETGADSALKNSNQKGRYEQDRGWPRAIRVRGVNLAHSGIFPLSR